MTGNTLYYGDNLDIFPRYIAEESVDLVYLDPPFNSNANYNVLFAEQDGARAASQRAVYRSGRGSSSSVTSPGAGRAGPAPRRAGGPCSRPSQ